MEGEGEEEGREEGEGGGERLLFSFEEFSMAEEVSRRDSFKFALELFLIVENSLLKREREEERNEGFGGFVKLEGERESKERGRKEGSK